MKFSCDFKFRRPAIMKAVKVAENFTKESLLEYLKGSIDNLRDFDKSAKEAILLLTSAIGLLGLGFTKKETIDLMESLFEREIYEEDLSPGSKKIN